MGAGGECVFWAVPAPGPSLIVLLSPPRSVTDCSGLLCMESPPAAAGDRGPPPGGPPQGHPQPGVPPRDLETLILS